MPRICVVWPHAIQVTMRNLLPRRPTGTNHHYRFQLNICDEGAPGYWTIVGQVTNWTGFRPRGNWQSKINGRGGEFRSISLLSLSASLCLSRSRFFSTFYFFVIQADEYAGNHRVAEPLSRASCPNPINTPVHHKAEAPPHQTTVSSCHLPAPTGSSRNFW